MTLYTELPDNPEPIKASELRTSMGEYLGATAAEAFHESPLLSTIGIKELHEAQFGAAIQPSEMLPWGSDEQIVRTEPSTPDVPMADAKARVKAAGLDKVLTLPAQETIREGALSIMIDRAEQRRERESVIARGPDGVVAGALGVGTSFLVGAMDPLNIAASFIPIVGEARWGKLMASAGENIFKRAGVRAGLGGATGAAFTAWFQPLEAYAHTQEGRDFTMAEALRNVIHGAALFGGMHVVGGAGVDVFRGLRGRPVYPYGKGEPFDRAKAAEDAVAVFERAKVAHDDIEARLQAPPGAEPSAEPTPIVHALDDLPPRAKEDAMQGAIANVTAGEPVRVGEMLEAAARTDPRIAESFGDALRARLGLIPEEPAADVTAPAGGVTPRGRGPASRHHDSWSLLEFIASRGGIDPTDGNIGDVRALFGGKRKFVPGFGDIVRKGGMKLDTMREAAVEAGYLQDHGDVSGGVGRSTISDLLNAMGEENGGKKVYKSDRLREHALKAEQARGMEEHRFRAEEEFDRALDEVGIKPEEIDDKHRSRVLEIMTREGEADPLKAYERAVMEGTHDGAQAAKHERIPEEIPGWDVPHDAGATPGAGRAIAAGGERGAGAGARQSGAGDRAAPADRATAFRDLARSPDDAAGVTASKAAEAAPDPGSWSPKAAERVAASEKSATEAAEAYRESETTIPDDIKALVEQKLAAIDVEVADRAEVIKRAAGCLTGGA